MNNTDKATGLTAAQTTGQHLDATATMLLQLTNSVDSRRWEIDGGTAHVTWGDAGDAARLREDITAIASRAFMTPDRTEAEAQAAAIAAVATLEQWTAIDTDNGDAYGPFPTLALAEAWVDGQTDADDFHIMRLRNPVDFTPHA